MSLADTAPEARRRQLAIYRSMSPERKVEIAFAMSEEADAAGIPHMVAGSVASTLHARREPRST